MLNGVIFHHDAFDHLRLSYLLVSNFVRFNGKSACTGSMGQFCFDSSNIKFKNLASNTIL